MFWTHWTIIREHVVPIPKLPLTSPGPKLEEKMSRSVASVWTGVVSVHAGRGYVAKTGIIP